jgi:hypothetical protein
MRASLGGRALDSCPVALASQTSLASQASPGGPLALDPCLAPGASLASHGGPWSLDPCLAPGASPVAFPGGPLTLEHSRVTFPVPMVPMTVGVAPQRGSHPFPYSIEHHLESGSWDVNLDISTGVLYEGPTPTRAYIPIPKQPPISLCHHVPSCGLYPMVFQGMTSILPPLSGVIGSWIVGGSKSLGGSY